MAARRNDKNANNRPRRPTWISAESTESDCSSPLRRYSPKAEAISSPSSSSIDRVSSPTKATERRRLIARSSVAASVTQAATFSSREISSLSTPGPRRKKAPIASVVSPYAAPISKIKDRKVPVQCRGCFPYPPLKHSRKNTYVSSTTDAKASNESLLVQLCRRRKWSEAHQRLMDHPAESIPIPILIEAKKERTFCQNATTNVAYHETALHIVSASASFKESSDISVHLFKDLLRRSPRQAVVSNGLSGHTALRELLRNPTCSPQAVQYILDCAQQELNDQAAFKSLCCNPDCDMLFPLDYCIMRFHKEQESTTDGEKRSHHAIDILKLLFDRVGTDRLLSQVYVSEAISQTDPLIRLFSMGNSHMRPASPQMVEAIQYLMDVFPPEYLKDMNRCVSSATGCTMLHLALRNYGNQPDIIQSILSCLTSASEEQSITNSPSRETKTISCIQSYVLQCLRHRNKFGDLPLHVACSVGVPAPILKLVLQGSVLASTPTDSICRESNLCWSVNNAGYTPIDLEWIRHVEDGKGLFTARSFYPIEAGCMKKTFWKQDKFYDVLLRYAAGQAIDDMQCSPPPPLHRDAQGYSLESSSTRKHKVSLNNRDFNDDTPPTTWELLLNRIYLIIQTAVKNIVPETYEDLTSDLLHTACELSFPEAPTLPAALLELIWNVFPEQIRAKQSLTGNTLLHCAVQPHLRNSYSFEASTGKIQRDKSSEAADQETVCNMHSKAWEHWVIKVLLKSDLTACCVPNHAGQLPLHTALYSSFVGESVSHHVWSSHETRDNGKIRSSEAQMRVIRAITEAFPEAVSITDCVSRLMPFQLAAICPNLSLEVVFYLLRRSPDALFAGKRR